ncbi:MAG: polyprenyl synthetase family protein [Candidatus Pacebacteria bacterium]|nr:polyprenyl synthetase family protein [Candidatus Paceibacterota bacterium]
MIEVVIGEIKEEIDQQIKNFLEKKREKGFLEEMPDYFFEFIDCVENFMLRGGKRLRPVLFCIGYDFWGDNERRREVVRISMLVEFLHAYLLIHDDVIDQDDFRHGGPSVHFKYKQKYLDKFKEGSAQHLGFSMAINIGDIVSAWVYEIAMDSDFEENKKIALVKKISEVMEMTLIGQVMDQEVGMGDDISFEKISMVQKYKTAKYTIEGPLQMGAILAGANKENLNFISSFAIPLGVAYQIQDDILGVFGDEDKIGKPVGADIRGGKKTLLVLSVLENAEKKDREFLLDKLGDKNVTKRDTERIRGIMINSGALDYSKKRILQLGNEFVSKLESGNLADERLSNIKELGHYLLDRDN